MTFVFDVCVDVYTAPASCPIVVDGIALFTKKAILFGSDGNVKRFTSTGHRMQQFAGRQCRKESAQSGLPGSGSRRALCTGLRYTSCCCPGYQIPDDICERFGGDFDTECSRSIFVTIGAVFHCTNRPQRTNADSGLRFLHSGKGMHARKRQSF